MNANVRTLQPHEVHAISQSDPTANRLRSFGEDLRKAKHRVDELTQILKRLDEESAALQEAGVTMTYTLGPIGDAAAACRRDLHKERPAQFKLPTREEPNA